MLFRSPQRLATRCRRGVSQSQGAPFEHLLLGRAERESGSFVGGEAGREGGRRRKGPEIRGNANLAQPRSPSFTPARGGVLVAVGVSHDLNSERRKESEPVGAQRESDSVPVHWKRTRLRRPAHRLRLESSRNRSQRNREELEWASMTCERSESWSRSKSNGGIKSAAGLRLCPALHSSTTKRRICRAFVAQLLT